MTDARKYAGEGSDPRAAARDLNAAKVVTGHLIRKGDKVVVTLMAVETESNRLLWHKTIILDQNTGSGAKVADSIVPELLQAVRK